MAFQEKPALGLCARQYKPHGVVEVLYVYGFCTRLELAIQRPIHAAGGRDAQMGCFAETEQLIIVSSALQCYGSGDELADVLRLAHEQDLKFAIMQVNLFGVEPEHAAHGGGIARHAEDELARVGLPLRLYSDGIGADVGEVLDASKI